MEELIARITQNVGVDADKARQSVGMILGFLQNEGPEARVAEMMDGLPGSRELVAETGGESVSGGVMGLGGKLMGLGLGMGEITGISKETISFAREKSGDEPVDDVIAAIPGLSQFV